MEVLTKLVPLTVSVNAGPPTVVLAGASEVTVGTGLLIEKAAVPEVPPPGAGFVTVILAEPVLTMSLAGTCAVTWVALTKLVASAVPFQFTVEPLTKPLPLTVSVNAAPATIALGGESELIVGP